MKEETIGELLDKYYKLGVRKAVTRMRKEAKRLTRQLEKDPDNIKLAIKCVLNPFCTNIKCDFLGKIKP